MDTSDTIIRIQCSCCGCWLWVDSVTRKVIKVERARKKKGSLDELLLKEQQKKKEADRRFVSTAELARKKQKEAMDKFTEAMKNIKSGGR